MKEAESIKIRFLIPIQINLKGLHSYGIEILNKDDKSPKGHNVIFLSIEKRFSNDILWYDTTSQYIKIQPSWLKASHTIPEYANKISFFFPYHNILQLEIEEKQE